MALELKQSLKLSQQLVITPQLQQAIKLLQLSRIELTELVDKELLENPILEDNEAAPQEEKENENQSASEKHEQAKDNGEERIEERPNDEVGSSDGTFKEPTSFDWENYVGTYSTPGYSGERDTGGEEAPTYENVLRQTESLQDHLLWQFHLSITTPREIEIGSELIGNINDDGYLQISIEEIASQVKATTQEVEAMLRKIQTFDPTGVGARDIKECLLLQLRHLDHDDPLTVEIIDKYMPELERHNFPQIAKSIGTEVSKVKEVAHIISNLEPKPGRPFCQEAPLYITPDVYVHKVGTEYHVSLNEDGLPKLRISEFYRRAIMKGSTVGDQTKDYIQERLRAATWLIKSIHQRQRTLYRVSQSIVKFQKEFFDEGISHLKPLILKDVADDIEMHESTISRVTTNKFMHTPRGIFELKFFFNSGISCFEGGGVASEAVKNILKKIIEKEDPKKPFSDQDIADHLKVKNIDIARRTVAKYREAMGILPSSRRRSHD